MLEKVTRSAFLASADRMFACLCPGRNSLGSDAVRQCSLRQTLHKLFADNGALMVRSRNTHP